MRNILVKSSCLGLAVVLLGSSGQATFEAADAPIAIAVADGQWRLNEGSAQGPRFARRPVLTYQAQVFPRLSLNLARLECSFPGGQRIEVTGMIPAQSFPQPIIAVRIGELAWAATPNADYHPRAAAVERPNLPDSMLDENLKGANLSIPGHPAYADLDFHRPFDREFLAALRSGRPIDVQFDGQQRRFPAVPAGLAARYAELCHTLVPPTLTSR